MFYGLTLMNMHPRSVSMFPPGLTRLPRVLKNIITQLVLKFGPLSKAQFRPKIHDKTS